MDLLHELFGYDKYTEITSEHAIRGTFCDLAIKIDGALALLIEVKAIGLDLKDQHVKQAVDYASNQGCEWVALTNGLVWRAYKVNFTKPIEQELVVEFNLSELSHRKDGDLEDRLAALQGGVAEGSPRRVLPATAGSQSLHARRFDHVGARHRRPAQGASPYLS